MDILKFIASVAIFVEYTPKQLQEFGYGLEGIVIMAIAIYLARTLIEVIAIRLGFDLAEVIIKFIIKIARIFGQYIKVLVYSFRLRVNGNLVKVKPNGKNTITWRWPINLISRFLTKGNHTKDKIVRFFKVADDIGILLTNAVPLMPTSIPALLYNLRRHKLPWYRFDNLSFIALIIGGIIRMLIVIWLTV